MINYIFDLDATLYRDNGEAEANFEHLINSFFMTKLNMSESETKQAREKILRQYHYEAMAIEDNFGISQKEFIDYICDIDISHLAKNMSLNELLAKLPGQCFIYTDSTKKHVKDTLKQIGVNEKIFKRIFVAEDNNFLFKFQTVAFEEFCRKCKIVAKDSILFEDNLRNISAAKKVGMSTVLISKEEQVFPDADYQFNSINQALEYFLQK